MNIFEYQDYKKFVTARIHSMPSHGRGEYQRIAAALKTHSTRVSHIFRGDLHLTLEQACSLGRYLGLSPLETEYLLTLVELERAGSEDLAKILRTRLQGIRTRAVQLVNRVSQDKVLSDQEKATFYSSWTYSGIRLFSSFEGGKARDEISQYFNLPRERVRTIVDFLLTTGLCLEKEGKIVMGPKVTHVESTSPLVSRHHANWRLKALQGHERLSEGELAYTGPVSIAKKDQLVIREMLITLIEKYTKLAAASEPADRLACLSVDWFEF